MPKGTIKRLMEQGFGFIKAEGKEEDLFFHRSALQNLQFTNLRQGQEVEFDIGKGPDGREQAVKVRLVLTKK